MIEIGNIRKKVDSHKETRGWIMGNFIPKNNFFHSENVEIKFAEHKKGTTYIGSTTSIYRKTLTILISGKIEFAFGKNHEKKFLLEKNFDFIAYDEIPGEHFLTILADSTLLTVREKF